MSSAAKQPERQGLSRTPQVGSQTMYAFFDAPGPQWLPGRPVTEQNLGAHRAYMGELYTQGRVVLGGPFHDEAGGGFAVVRAASREEATALLAADPAIKEGVFTGIVRPARGV